MAITINKMVDAGNNASSTSWAPTIDANSAAGSFLVLFVAADNSSSGGSTNNITSVTDSLGNTWTKQQGPVYDTGSANNGIQGAIFTTPMDAGVVLTSSTVTINFGDSTTAKAFLMFEVVPDTGYRIEYVQSGDDTAGATTSSPSLTTGTITSGNVVFGAFFCEYGSGASATQDSDTTNGSWSTYESALGGVGTTGVTVYAQHKIVTGTGTQTYNITFTSTDIHGSWIELAEVLNTSIPVIMNSYRQRRN